MLVAVNVEVEEGMRVWVEVGGGVKVAEPASNVKLSVNVPAVEPTNWAEIAVSETVYCTKPKRGSTLSPIHLAK